MWLHLSNAQIRVIISFVPYRFCLPAAAENVCLILFFFTVMVQRRTPTRIQCCKAVTPCFKTSYWPGAVRASILGLFHQAAALIFFKGASPWLLSDLSAPRELLLVKTIQVFKLV